VQLRTWTTLPIGVPRLRFRKRPFTALVPPSAMNWHPWKVVLFTFVVPLSGSMLTSDAAGERGRADELAIGELEVFALDNPVRVAGVIPANGNVERRITHRPAYLLEVRAVVDPTVIDLHDEAVAGGRAEHCQPRPVGIRHLAVRRRTRRLIVLDMEPVREVPTDDLDAGRSTKQIEGATRTGPPRASEQRHVRGELIDRDAIALRTVEAHVDEPDVVGTDAGISRLVADEERMVLLHIGIECPSCHRERESCPCRRCSRHRS
jgi:hypothetical protein